MRSLLHLVFLASHLFMLHGYPTDQGVDDLIIHSDTEQQNPQEKKHNGAKEFVKKFKTKFANRKVDFERDVQEVFRKQVFLVNNDYQVQLTEFMKSGQNEDKRLRETLHINITKLNNIIEVGSRNNDPERVEILHGEKGELLRAYHLRNAELLKKIEDYEGKIKKELEKRTEDLSSMYDTFIEKVDLKVNETIIAFNKNVKMISDKHMTKS